MKLVLTSVGHATQYLPFREGKIQVEFQQGETLEDILNRLSIPQDLFMFFLVGDMKTDLSYAPKDGDQITLVSPIMGG